MPMRRSPPMNTPSKEAFTIREFAYATTLAESTVRALYKDGTLRVVRLGRAIRIPRSELTRLFGDELTHAIAADLDPPASAVPLPTVRPLWTVDEVVAFTGWGRSTIYDGVRDGTIRAVRIGDTIRIPAAEAERLVTPSHAQ